jgi:hypothetical protein
VSKSVRKIGGRGAWADENRTMHRRHALMLASQLPEDQSDALAVLQCTRDLVTNFLQADMPEPVKAPAPVVTLVRPRPELSA